MSEYSAITANFCESPT